MEEVRLSKIGISIHGEKKILLCASLFYFRIPRSEWEDRIKKLKASGYNCVDVYFPWNYHETAPSEWDFSGEKDVEKFLKLLEIHGLYVIARPGPYICSEWDGGAIPAWVLTDRSLHVRQNDPKYLSAVRHWYEKILPRIARHQISQGGSVILVQLENELDFYNCKDPSGYIGALRDMARKAGITVPLFSCAGQSDVNAATGRADGVEISYNFYGDVKDPIYGDKFHYYYEQMRKINRPLLISETNCDHLFLRRELAAGAKLLGAYNQVGGTNFGLTGGVNNWGGTKKPLSFITTLYSGKNNMIGSAGELQEQYYEGRQLAGLIHVFGAELGEAESVACEDAAVKADFPYGLHLFRLVLPCGGTLLCIPNLGEKDGTAHLRLDSGIVNMKVIAHSAPFYPFHIPLSLFGHAGGTLLKADGELEDFKEERGTLTLTVWTESEAPFVEFLIDGEHKILTRKEPVCKGIQVRFYKKEELRCRPLCGVQTLSFSPAGVETKAVPLRKVRLGRIRLSDFPSRPGNLLPLEKLGVYRGGGSYQFRVLGKGVLLLGGSDIISVYRDKELCGAYASAGGAKYYPGSGQYDILSFIWGHSNFSDSRLPAMELDSERGITKAVDVHSIRNISCYWCHETADCPSETLKQPRRDIETIMQFDSWNTPRIPAKGIYRKKISLDSGCDTQILEMRGLAADATVYVDGKNTGRVNPRNPFLEISRFTRGKSSVKLAIFLNKRDWAEPAGIPYLYSGVSIKNCEFSPLTEKTLIQFAKTGCQSNGVFPIAFKPGEIYHISIPYQSAGDYIRFSGENIIAFAFSGDRILGRILLWKDGPKMAAGDPECLYVPKSCQSSDFQLLIFALGENAGLHAIMKL